MKYFKGISTTSAVSTRIYARKIRIKAYLHTSSPDKEKLKEFYLDYSKNNLMESKYGIEESKHDLALSIVERQLRKKKIHIEKRGGLGFREFPRKPWCMFDISSV